MLRVRERPYALSGPWVARPQSVQIHERQRRTTLSDAGATSSIVCATADGSAHSGHQSPISIEAGTACTSKVTWVGGMTTSVR